MQGYINVVRAYPPKTFPISAALAFPASTTLKRMLSGSSDFCGKAQTKKKKIQEMSKESDSAKKADSNYLIINGV
jgi:hypothetical protein